MNRIALIGNLTRDPELRATGSGVMVCTFTVAVSRRHGGQDGERATDFFRINAWRQLGEACGQHLKKGRKVAVTGALYPRSYVDRSGDTRFSLDVLADEVEFLTPKSRQEAAGDGGIAGVADEDGFVDVSTADIPF